MDRRPMNEDLQGADPEGEMKVPAVLWKLPVGTLGVVVGFVVGLVAAYLAGFTASEVVLPSGLGGGAILGGAALAIEGRLRLRMMGRYQWLWLIGLWVAALVALGFVIKRIS
jgi:hypothetical protein